MQQKTVKITAFGYSQILQKVADIHPRKATKKCQMSNRNASTQILQKVMTSALFEFSK